MKTVKLIATALCLSLCFGVVASAQEDGNRDENNKIVREPYLTNGAWANWWVGVAGGISAFGDGGYTAAVTPAFDATLGKWFTPSIGARIGYQGFNGAMWSANEGPISESFDPQRGKYKDKFGNSYIHADFLWNISNAFSGYKETRFWDVIPYVHSGLNVSYKVNKKFTDLEYGMGAGILNNLRLTDRLDLTLDLRGLLLSGRHHAADGGVSGEISFTAGLAYDLGKNNWVRAINYHNPADADRISALEASKQALEASEASLKAKNDKLQKENYDLNDEIEELKSRPVTTAKLTDVDAATFYFEIGKTVLSKKELAHLDFYLNNVLPNVDDAKVTVLTGRADSQTGSQRRNTYLSQKRVEYLQNLLVEKYDVDASNFQVRSDIVKSDNPSFDRAVVISFE